MDANKRKEILDTVAKLRVTDIRDGMDWVGLHHVGTVDPEIRPLYRTKAAGFAQTYRHIPTQQRVPELSPEDYTKWAYEYWYRQLWNMGDFKEQVGEGDFLVIDTMGQKTPAIGSMDSMVWAANGVKGVLTNGGARDTDEQLYQKAMPCWHRWVVQPMYQGRVEFGEPNSTVEIGGAMVRPGDLVVADGDGAIVVPQDVIDDVLYYAKQESENDRYDRGMLFEALGIAPDESTQSMFPDMPPHPYKKNREDFMKRLRKK
ncbi:MAG: RraA family protein [Devosia marina]|uniref:RraA family protein n=1 Tax=Devosia marina TaxID=2683198 RepID=UPI0032ED562F